MDSQFWSTQKGDTGAWELAVDVVGPNVIDVISEGASPFGSRMARDAADAPLAFSFRPAILAVVTTTHSLGTLLFLSYN